jgi:hypothetical protein
VIYEEAVMRELQDDFRCDTRHFGPFSSDEYDARKAASRLVDSTLRLFSPLL